MNYPPVQSNHDLTGPKTRVESVLKAYNEGEYDFGIDYTVVMNITGYEIDDAKELIKVHSKNESGMSVHLIVVLTLCYLTVCRINAIALLITIISLGNGENRNELGRLESVFDLMDFSHNSQITMDEMVESFSMICLRCDDSFSCSPQTILLLCVGSSFAFITGRSEDSPIDTAIIQFGKHIYESMGKKPTNYVTKEEFAEWTKEHVFSQGFTSIVDILGLLANGPETQQSSASQKADMGVPVTV